jgi:hypothetical protein
MQCLKHNPAVDVVLVLWIGFEEFSVFDEKYVGSGLFSAQSDFLLLNIECG